MRTGPRAAVQGPRPEATCGAQAIVAARDAADVIGGLAHAPCLRQPVRQAGRTEARRHPGGQDMAHNTARMVGGAVLAVALAVAVVALLPRIAPDLANVTPPAADASVPATTAMGAPAPQATPDAPPTGPRVDTFLLGLDGVAVVAGHATPGARVTILLDGAPLTEAQADGGGGFAATAQIAASDKPRSLTFAENDDAPSGETVLVRPGAGSPRLAAPTVAANASSTPAADAAIASNDTTPSVPETSSVSGDETRAVPIPRELPADGATDTVAADAGDPTAAGPAVAPNIKPDASDAPAQDTVPAPTIVVDAAGARVMGPGPQVMDRVALDAITYDTAGEVLLAGRAPGDGTLQVYINNRPVTTAPVGVDGDWRLTLPPVDAGTYTLRIDALNAQGQVASRVETPFRREAPADVQAATDAGAAMGALTQTVQPGSTLWAIARDNLGDGMLYVSVFNANADQIRDPDLIYPGQVFVIPDR
ncbi:LysM peptidoglycan-binding domain-containing protein [Loktanella sp. M215]|uniref:LysM peptidoglycan-binding domain-containing protein n=1 Tax=Loktanella sp. M215 TaxID=2675431 RepID=UPI001F3C1463|nr:LysM peptidoglycan-binding domain-containing protein [Loktanella sp. M215]